MFSLAHSVECAESNAHKKKSNIAKQSGGAVSYMCAYLKQIHVICTRSLVYLVGTAQHSTAQQLVCRAAYAAVASVRPVYDERK